MKKENAEKLIKAIDDIEEVWNDYAQTIDYILKGWLDIHDIIDKRYITWKEDLEGFRDYEIVLYDTYDRSRTSAFSKHEMTSDNSKRYYTIPISPDALIDPDAFLEKERKRIEEIRLENAKTREEKRIESNKVKIKRDKDLLKKLKKQYPDV